MMTGTLRPCFGLPGPDDVHGHAVLGAVAVAVDAGLDHEVFPDGVLVGEHRLGTALGHRDRGPGGGAGRGGPGGEGGEGHRYRDRDDRGTSPS